MSLDPRDVTAVIPTRGGVDLEPILDSLVFRNVLVWDNSRLRDLGAYGRYEAACCAPTEVVYTQDDDCVVSAEAQLALLAGYEAGLLLSNMDANHNGTAMPLLALPGWGSLFETRLVEDAWSRWSESEAADYLSGDFLRIGCDIVFPVLTPSRMVDLGHENLPYAWDAERTHRRPGYGEKKGWYYHRAADIRRIEEW